MMKFVILLLALAVVVSSSGLVDVIPHYSHHGHGHGVSTRYFRKAQGHALGYGGYGLGGLGYGGYGLGYGGYGLGGLGYGGYGLGGYGGYGLGYGGYGYL